MAPTRPTYPRWPAGGTTAAWRAPRRRAEDPALVEPDRVRVGRVHRRVRARRVRERAGVDVAAIAERPARATARRARQRVRVRRPAGAAAAAVARREVAVGLVPVLGDVADAVAVGVDPEVGGELRHEAASPMRWKSGSVASSHAASPPPQCAPCTVMFAPGGSRAEARRRCLERGEHGHEPERAHARDRRWSAHWSPSRGRQRPADAVHRLPRTTRGGGPVAPAARGARSRRASRAPCGRPPPAPCTRARVEAVQRHQWAIASPTSRTARPRRPQSRATRAVRERDDVEAVRDVGEPPARARARADARPAAGGDEAGRDLVAARARAAHVAPLAQVRARAARGSGPDVPHDDRAVRAVRRRRSRARARAAARRALPRRQPQSNGSDDGAMPSVRPSSSSTASRAAPRERWSIRSRRARSSTSANVSAWWAARLCLRADLRPVCPGSGRGGARSGPGG